MESVTLQTLQAFFQRLGKQLSAPTTIYLLGGSALCLLGSLRETILEQYFQSILPLARSTDIDPKEFQQYFDTLRISASR